MRKKMTFAIPHGRSENREQQLKIFADELIKIQDRVKSSIPYITSRGWCYELENKGLINKGEFNRCQDIINECRKKGFLPIDFTKEDGVRTFTTADYCDTKKPIQYLKSGIENILTRGEIYNFDFWEKENYYIMMLVEKEDLVTLFEPISNHFHIPLANSRGWDDINNRAYIAKRFKKHEEQGQQCILLQCGDHDPFGLAISNYLYKNLRDIEGGTGYNPQNLIIDRFGLNYDFIIKNNLTWIDNLITGSGKQPNKKNPIVKSYIDQFGEKKVEANALVARPVEGKKLCLQTIQKYLGKNAWSRFIDKRNRCIKWFDAMLEYYDIKDPIQEVADKIKIF